VRFSAQWRSCNRPPVTGRSLRCATLRTWASGTAPSVASPSGRARAAVDSSGVAFYRSAAGHRTPEPNEPGSTGSPRARAAATTRSGSSSRTSTGRRPPSCWFLVVEDIADRKELEAQLLHRSLHDPLTGLPNRQLFRDRFRHALERGCREHTPTCLLIVDLDGFKAVNDRLGHPVGDRVLVAFAERLLAGLRASDTAARLGGDEFGVLCENTDRPEAEVLAARLRAAIGIPLVLDGTELRLGASIGIGFVPGGTDSGHAYERVVREADDAMYAMKRRRD
jgi:diguanylate cyclase (GGDEF)-like protein